jgi:hypothetical protein
MSAGWSVTYKTATIQAGTAPTKAEAERIAANVHDSYVIKGLNPDALAWHVEADRRCPDCQNWLDRYGRCLQCAEPAGEL